MVADVRCRSRVAQDTRIKGRVRPEITRQAGGRISGLGADVRQQTGINIGRARMAVSAIGQIIVARSINPVLAFGRRLAQGIHGGQFNLMPELVGNGAVRGNC